jgi:2',3'-cyclic-nucleotide 2'-phosphodiesterase (5'-nucleotidase family)
LARRATFIKSTREQKENVLLLDAGDSLLTLQRVGDLEQGRLLAEAFNRMGYDAIALGGMDFRMGLDVLREQIRAADLAVLSANTLDPQTNEFWDADYVILEREGHRIALIGLTDPKIAVEVTQGEVKVMEPVESLLDIVESIKDDADIIIVLSHLGALFDFSLGQVVSGIDLIVSGKDREVYTSPLEANGVVIVSAGSRGEYIGQIDLQFDAAGNLVSYDGHVQLLLADIADDPELQSWMASSGMIPASAPKSGGTGKLNP